MKKIFFLKRFLLIILLTLIFSNLLRAQSPKIEWQKCLGGTLSDDYSRKHVGHITKSILQTSDNGYIIIGEAISNDGNVSGNHGLKDIWIVKLISSGTLQWQKCYGGSQDEEATSIINTSDGGYIITGITNSNDGDVKGNHGGEADIWVLKIDWAGQVQWQKCLGGNDFDTPWSIIQTLDGGYAICGYTFSTNEDFKNHGSSDSYVIKLDSSGILQWQKLYGGSSAEGGGVILQTSDGGYILAANTSSNDSNVYGNHLDSIWTSNDIWLVKLDSSGNISWQKCIGGRYADFRHSFIKTKDGGYVLAGFTHSDDGDVSGKHSGFHNLNYADAWIIKFDSSLNILWQKCFGGSKEDDAYSILQTLDGGYVFAGVTTSTDGDVNGKHGGSNDSSDIWIVKLSPSGFLEWQKCIGGTNKDEAYSVIQTSDGGFAIHGYTNSVDGDISFTNHGKEDMWIVKLSKPESFIENLPHTGSNFSWPFPNPSNGVIRLMLYNNQIVKKVTFYDLLGIEHFPTYSIENTLASVDVHDLPPGSYIMRVKYISTDRDEIRKFLKE